MKKQNSLVKIVGLQLVVILLFQLVIVLVHTPFIGVANAAAARCYIGSLDSVVAQTQCPTPTSSSSDIVRYSDGGPLDTTPATCYGSPAATPPGSGPRTVSYAPADCEVLASQARAYSESLCTASGGDWVIPTRGAVPPQCDCPDDKPFSATSRQCVVATLTQAEIDAQDDSIGTVNGPTVDCVSEGGTGDLNGENCGIVGLLNTVFNLVSGGIALAVIGNIIVAGIQYSTAQGDPSASGKAKNRIQGALIAFLMYLGLYAFLQWLIPGGVF